MKAKEVRIAQKSDDVVLRCVLKARQSHVLEAKAVLRGHCALPNDALEGSTCAKHVCSRLKPSDGK